MRVLISDGISLIGRALSENLASDNQGVILRSRSPERAILRLSETSLVGTCGGSIVGENGYAS
jgi:hypothetical protein